MRLPDSVQELADVIGRDKALYLIGKLPRYTPPIDKTAKGGRGRVVLYVPTLARLTPEHRLVSILGWIDAAAICREFGGLILQLATCQSIVRAFWDRTILELSGNGQSPAEIAEQMGLSARYVQIRISLTKPHKEQIAANDNNAPNHEQGVTNAVAGCVRVIK